MAKKIKIGTVTYVRTDNYGAELQGYALQEKLNNLGYDAECINFCNPGIDRHTYIEMARRAIFKRLKNNPFTAISQILGIVTGIIKSRLKKADFKESSRRQNRESAFNVFWEKQIRHSVKYEIEELGRIGDSYNVFIAGSDQIWNYTRTSALEPYFLSFAGKNAGKMSYAASFSVSEIPNNLVERYRNLINNIDIISLREQSGVTLVKELTGRDAKLVLDPTLLLTKKEWIKVANDRYGIQEPYILTYSLNSSKAYWKIVYRHARKLGLRVINLRHDFADKKIPEFQTDIYDAGPAEFLHLVANASLVITNSFHGTIFSINFEVPFISVLSRISETNSRIESFLDVMNLTDRLIYDDDTSTMILSKIDFDKSAELLNEYREDSISFLTNSINTLTGKNG